MGIAVWCDVKDKGHPFDQRAAIIITGGNDDRYYCKEHCLPAFAAAFMTARDHGQSGIWLPTLGG
jgi:hypothetical protein